MHDIWNPWHGCKKCSEGCKNCYMYFLDEQRGKSGADIYRTKAGFRYPLTKDRLGRYKVQSGEQLRVCMTSDFFLQEADPWRDEAWGIIRQRPDVVFFLLTKRPERVRGCLPHDWGEGWENVFFNVSCENQKRADERIPILLELPFKHKGVMCAPLIGEITLEEYLSTGQVEQVLCDGENYAGARPCRYEWVKRLAAENAPDLTVCLADEQTAGKGRLGRVWRSPAGTSVSMSVLLRPEVPPERLSMLTLVMGMAAADGIREISGIQAGIKWPNDVVSDGRKLCGILTEAGPDVSYIVIGIGINVNMESFPDELRDKAASLYMCTGRKYSRVQTAAAVLNAFLGYYRMFCRTFDMSGLKEDYQRLLVNVNQPVRVLDPKEPFNGTARGIDNLGDLIVEKENGETVHVYSGEVSVRGIYGYV